MKLQLKGDLLEIKLNPLEMLLSFHGSLKIPLDNIAFATTENPGYSFGSRAPGTHIPLLLKAGTYLTANGREFWSTTIGMPYLVIETRDWGFDRIVLTLSENKQWAERLNGTES